MSVGKKMKERRKELGISADYLAEVLGVSRSTVFRYENGDIEKMPIDALKPIAKALQIEPIYLMGWEEPQQKTPLKKGVQVICKAASEITMFFFSYTRILHKKTKNNLLFS